MLGQRRRRWPNIKTALDQCLVWVVPCNQFSGYINAVNLYSIGYCWPSLDRPRHARFEAEWFFNSTRPAVTLDVDMIAYNHIEKNKNIYLKTPRMISGAQIWEACMTDKAVSRSTNAPRPPPPSRYRSAGVAYK